MACEHRCDVADQNGAYWNKNCVVDESDKIVSVENFHNDASVQRRRQPPIDTSRSQNVDAAVETYIRMAGKQMPCLSRRGGKLSGRWWEEARARNCQMCRGPNDGLFQVLTVQPVSFWCDDLQHLKRISRCDLSTCMEAFRISDHPMGFRRCDSQGA